MQRAITFPNVLSVSRMVMAALAVVLALHGQRAWAVSICIAAALLDVVDGWHARRFSSSTRLGAHLDPLADKVLMGVVYGWLAIDARSATVWALVGLLAAREGFVTGLRAWSRRSRGELIPASRLGRAKMLAESVAGLTILGVTHYLGRPVAESIVVAAVAVPLVLAYVSAAAYVRGCRARAAGLESKGACRRPEADPLCATQDHG